MKPTLPQLPPDLCWESRIAESLGVSRTHLRQLRKNNLQPGRDWSTRENAVVLTAEGVAKITALLAEAGATAPDSGDFAAQGTPTPTPVRPHPAAGNGGTAAMPPGPPPKALWMVTRIPVFRTDRPQQKVLICRTAPAGTPQIAPWDVPRYLARLGGHEQAIRVRDNRMFITGMVLEAVNIGHGMWQYLGRLPRRPGRW